MTQRRGFASAVTFAAELCGWLAVIAGGWVCFGLVGFRVSDLWSPNHGVPTGLVLLGTALSPGVLIIGVARAYRSHLRYHGKRDEMRSVSDSPESPNND